MNAKMKIRHKRIGPRMAQVVLLVETEPGQVMIDVAEAVGPRGSLQFGYESVWRAVKAGLIEARERPERRGSYRLYPKEVGR